MPAPPDAWARTELLFVQCPGRDRRRTDDKIGTGYL